MADERHPDGAEPSGSEGGPPIVAIGASAGGVVALQRLFETLPANLGASFVVVVHLDPDAHSELPAILADRSAYPVVQVTDASALKPDHIYVIAPDRQLRISDHEISAAPFDEPRGRRLPIDHFFRSLAQQKGDGCAVVLTGAGSDGAAGAKAIRAAGGIVLVQDPEEAEYPSMPRSAIAAEAADFVLPLRDLSARLVDLVRTRRAALSQPGRADDEDVLRRILAHLRARTGHDFGHYKRTTVRRRVVRRMQVARADTISAYFEYLRRNAAESQALLGDLLISVTGFFRDPHAFETLAAKIVPKLFADDDESPPIRVWVAGCATGEEAYSLGMLLLEEAARHEVRPQIQIFASDIDSSALAIAREGRYPAAIAADVSEERLRRFFTEDGDHYRVRRDLRDAVLFASHSVLKDPPFSRLDLISCRNLLIYLERDMQQQVLATLHYGLKASGFLFLGASESAEHPARYFRAVEREARIFQSTGRSRDHIPALQQLPATAVAGTAPPQPDDREPASRSAGLQHRRALETAAPPSVLVDRSWRVVHLSESAGRYLQPSSGPLSADIAELVRPELRQELRAALHRAFERDETILSSPVFVQFNGTAHRTYMQVRPAADEHGKSVERALVLFFESGAEDRGLVTEAGEPAAGVDIMRLQQELDLSRQQLRNTREDSEASDEELRAANEELQSINEEYRSTAEELETSKEELQSINEELQTVNSELKQKVDIVSRTNGDLVNLMAATDVGTLFLDQNLRIRRFTPRLAELFSITPPDIGRTVTDFSHRLDYDGFADDARRVLRDLNLVEREIHSLEDAWILLRFRPYRTLDDKIDGVVVTFMDVTERRKMENSLRDSEHRLKQEARLVDLSRAPIFVWEFGGGIVQWNRGSEELYGYTRAEALGRTTDELLRADRPGASHQAFRRELEENGTWLGELRHVDKAGRVLDVESRAELVVEDGCRLVFESTRDITAARLLETRQELLVAELTHRVKNLLTVVQGIVHQTRRNSASAAEFEAKIDGRLGALGNALKLLVASTWKGADLRDLIEHQVAPQAGEDPGRLKLDGEPVTLPPDVATPLGLVLHELATNAVKYGALSRPKGHIDLHWRRSAGAAGDRVEIVWTEAGGPKVEGTAKSGFGSRLIGQGIPGAHVKHELLPGGVRCTIDLPLTAEAGAG